MSYDPSGTGGELPMAAVRAVDMTGTGDNALTWLVAGTPAKYIIRRVLVVRLSGAFNTACLGGLYTASSKGGSALVAATQTYANLTGAGKCVDAGIAAVATTDVTTAAILYFALSTGNGAALTADVLVYGDILD